MTAAILAARPAPPGTTMRPDTVPGIATRPAAVPGFAAVRCNARVQVLLHDRRTRADPPSLVCRWSVDADGRLAAAWAHQGSSGSYR